ncbi:UNVERIFIED_CONTAM: Taf1a [Trichonephila clavipes]
MFSGFSTVLKMEMQTFEFLNNKETVLDYVICGLRNNFSNLGSKLKPYKNVSVMLTSDFKEFSNKKIFHSEKWDTIDLLLKAYCAYINCAYGCDTGFFVSDSQFSQASQMSVENTIVKFQSLIQNPGDWDIFVLKLIELLYVSDKEEEVKEVLLNYVERNPNHLNAHIYICEFLKNYDPDSKTLIQHLECEDKY